MTAISENVYFDVLDDIVNKDFDKKNPKFKVGDHVRISKYKNIFAKRYAPNWSEEIFVVSRIKNTVPWTYVIIDLNDGKITGSFYEKELQTTSQEEFRIEKGLKRKGDKLYVKWKDYDNRFNSWIDKKDLIYEWVNTFLNHFGGNINVEVASSNYATKTYLKNVTHTDTSSFPLEANLASWKIEFDKLDIDKLAPVPVDLSKLRDVLKMMLLKKMSMIKTGSKSK